VFMGDLLFIERHPYMGHGNPRRLTEIMELVMGMEPRHVVPGHGPVGGRQHLRTMVDYVQAVEGHAAELRNRGVQPTDVSSLRIPAPFDTWWYGRFYPGNVRFMLRQLESSGGS
jgi:cyclase